ncbi:hypothetical protein Taro_027234 [Colocasia esculenta]|uniref:Uncharacterized protein n=1 Tax=Colocasia esculenta TaxID=4460 RepID=A0A843VE07_COLES|nr:hypothetical protein [Colocasia esculenta]
MEEEILKLGKGRKYTLLGSWEAGLELPREEETAPTRSFFPVAFCFNLCRQPFLWSTKVLPSVMFPTTFML